MQYYHGIYILKVEEGTESWTVKYLLICDENFILSLFFLYLSENSLVSDEAEEVQSLTKVLSHTQKFLAEQIEHAVLQHTCSLLRSVHFCKVSLCRSVTNNCGCCWGHLCFTGKLHSQRINGCTEEQGSWGEIWELAKCGSNLIVAQPIGLINISCSAEGIWLEQTRAAGL